MYWAALFVAYGNWKLTAAHCLLKKDIACSSQLHCKKANADGNSRSPAQSICLVIVFSTWITMLTHSCTPEASEEMNCVLSLSFPHVTWATEFFYYLGFFLKCPESIQKSPFKALLCSSPPFQLHRQQLTMKQRINLPGGCVSMLPEGLAGSCVSANRMQLHWLWVQSASALA